MARQTIALPEVLNIEPPVSPAAEIRQESLALLLSIIALLCCSLELELIERLDGMKAYMTPGEILWDASVALVILVGATLVCCGCLMLLAKIIDIIPAIAPYSKFVFWYVGLAFPLSYFVFSVCNAIRLRVYPQWHPGPLGFTIMSLTAAALCSACLWGPRLPALQRFCKMRLGPVGWLHIAVTAVAVVALSIHGVHFLRGFAHPGNAVAASVEPDVYLITVDALRTRDMSLYGYTRPTTPNLDHFATRAFVFDYFFANATFTDPATSSIETGTLPWTHRAFHQGGFLRGEMRQENIAKLMHEHGYYTAMIASNYFASPFHHGTHDSYDAVELSWWGNDLAVWQRVTNLAGFNTLYTLSGPLLKPVSIFRRYLDALPWSDRYAGPEMAFDRTRRLIERQDIAQPRFIWTHILPPHDPYVPPPAYRGRFLPGSKLTRKYDFLGLGMTTRPAGVSAAELQARYDEHICYADHLIGDFLDWLDQTGRLDRSIIIIAADHGESFEHNWFTHGGPYLYNGLVQVPLLVHLPGQKQGSRISQAAEQVDLLPTILDLVGGQIPNWTEGTSLVPALNGKSLPARLLFSMNLESNSAFQPITHGTIAILDEEFKYIKQLGTQDRSLYRYKTDPSEEQNLINDDPGVARRMENLMTQRLREVNRQVVPAH